MHQRDFATNESIVACLDRACSGARVGEHDPDTAGAGASESELADIGEGEGAGEGEGGTAAAGEREGEGEGEGDGVGEGEGEGCAARHDTTEDDAVAAAHALRCHGSRFSPHGGFFVCDGKPNYQIERLREK